jgi:uncharacterized protein YrrD
MRFGAIKGSPVVSIKGGEQLGEIDDVFFNPDSNTVLALGVKKGGLISHHLAVMLPNVQAVGGDAVTVSESGVVNEVGKFDALRETTPWSKLQGAKIMTENGVEVGKAGDIDMDFSVGSVKGYVLTEGLIGKLMGSEHEIAVSDVKTVGDKLIVVSNGVAVS